MYTPLSFEFTIGGYFGPSYEFSLKAGELTYRTFTDQYEPKAEATIKPSPDEWRTFREGVDNLDIWNWKDRYEVPVCDGTSWTLEIEYADRSINSSGSNAYPGDPPAVSADEDGSKRFSTFLKHVHDLISGLEFTEADAFDEDRSDLD